MGRLNQIITDTKCIIDFFSNFSFPYTPFDKELGKATKIKLIFFLTWPMATQSVFFLL